MLTLAASDTIAADADAGSVLTYTIFGMTLVASVEAYDVLAQGQAPSIASAAIHPRTASDHPIASDAAYVGHIPVNRLAAESMALAEVIARTLTAPRLVAETFASTEATVKLLLALRFTAESLRLRDAAISYRVNRIAVTDAAAYAVALGQSVVYVVTLADARTIVLTDIDAEKYAVMVA